MKNLRTRLLKVNLDNVVEFFIDMIFPNRCPCCKKVIRYNELICQDCIKQLDYLDDIPWQIRYPNSICGDKIFYDYVVSAFPYQMSAKEGIYALKNGVGTNFAKFASQILSNKLENDEKCDFDLITCIPMFKRKKSLRGYNQAQVLAKYLSKSLSKPMIVNLLCRSNESLEQHSLNSKERHKMAGEIYFENPKHEEIKGKTILLCDDVFTTGATMNKCCELLKNMGAIKVYCLSICYTELVLSKSKE